MLVLSASVASVYIVLLGVPDERVGSLNFGSLDSNIERQCAKDVVRQLVSPSAASSHFCTRCRSNILFPPFLPCMKPKQLLCEAIDRFRLIATEAQSNHISGRYCYCSFAIFRVYEAERQALLLTL